jgi:hypothetical protein
MQEASPEEWLVQIVPKRNYTVTLSSSAYVCVYLFSKQTLRFPIDFLLLVPSKPIPE